MSWSILPDDVVHIIFASVCLIDLARMSTTCSSFHAAYRRRMVVGQEARRQLAVKTFGAQRIARILDLTGCPLKMEPLPPGFEGNDGDFFRIRADGLLYGPVTTLQTRAADGDIDVRFWTARFPSWSGTGSNIHVREANGGWSLELAIFPFCVKIDVTPTKEEDLLPVALLQALLSEGLTQALRDVGRHAEVCIGRQVMEWGFTQAGLEAQVVPLLPFASRYTPVETAARPPVCERMCIGQVLHQSPRKSTRNIITKRRPRIWKALEA